jgi:hypothetical protein
MVPSMHSDASDRSPHDETLGPVVASFRAKRKDTKPSMTQALVSLGFAATLAASNPMIAMFLMGVAALSALWAARLRWENARNARDELSIHGGGIELLRAGVRSRIHWQDVASVEYLNDRALVMPVLGAHRLDERELRAAVERRVGGLRVRLLSSEVPLRIDGHWERLGAARECIDEGHAAAALDARLARLSVLGSLTFGPLTIEPKGIVVDGRSLEWSSIRSVKSQGGLLVIERSPAGRFCAIPLSEVPSPALARRMLETLRAPRALAAYG